LKPVKGKQLQQENSEYNKEEQKVETLPEIKEGGREEEKIVSTFNNRTLNLKIV
jgi:hypothetical protein